MLSFGAAVPGYHWLYDHVPLLQGIRAVVRFGWLWLLALAVLAGAGLARLERRWPARATALTIGGRRCSSRVEAARTPMAFTRFEGIPPIYGHVAALPDAVLAEFPFPDPAVIQDNGPYVLASTVHFRPMLNGYSGFTPASYFLHAAVARRFPSAESLREFGLPRRHPHGRARRAHGRIGGRRPARGHRTGRGCSPAKATIGSTRSSRRRRDAGDASWPRWPSRPVLAVFHTWPLARDVGGQSRLDNADTALNTWIVSWVAHQLPRDPAPRLRRADLPSRAPHARLLRAPAGARRDGDAAARRRPVGRPPPTTCSSWPASR